MRNQTFNRLRIEKDQFIKDPSSEVNAYPVKDDLFTWHFTLRGVKDTEFEGGYYHGIIKLPTKYPYEPPSILFLNPNGRFEVNVDVCLSVTRYHKEQWQAAWTIRTILYAISAFFQVKEETAAIGALNYPNEARQKLAIQSQKWSCDICGLIKNTIKSLNNNEGNNKSNNEDNNIKNKEVNNNDNKDINIKKTNTNNDETNSNITLGNNYNVENANNNSSYNNTIKQSFHNTSNTHTSSKKNLNYKKKTDKNNIYSNIKNTIIEDNEEYYEDAKNNNNSINEELKKSSSLDNSGNIEFSEQLRKLRLNQFANLSNNNYINKNNTDDIVNKTDMNNYSYLNNISNKSNSSNNFDKISDNSNNKNADINKYNTNKKPSLASLNKNVNLNSDANIQESKSNYNYSNLTYTNNSYKNTINNNKLNNYNDNIYNFENKDNVMFSNTSKILEDTNNNSVLNEFIFNEEECDFKQSLLSVKETEIPENEYINNENKYDSYSMKATMHIPINYSKSNTSKLNSKEIKKKVDLKLKDINFDLIENKESLIAKKLEKAIITRKQAYNILLIQKYRDSKYKRISICLFIFILVLSLVLFLYFSQSTRQMILNFINNIPIEININ